MAIKYRTNEMIVAISLLVPNSWNPNEETDFMQEKLSNSLERFGQVAEVLVRRLPSGDFEIIDGEHRWRQMAKAGATEILVNVLEDVTDDEAKMLTMVANELHGNRNPVRLAKILRDLEKESDWKEILALMPYNSIELTNLMEIDPDMPEPPEFSAERRKDSSAGPVDSSKGWVDIKISIHHEQYPEVERMLEQTKKDMGISTRPDKALENGEVLRKLVITSS